MMLSTVIAESPISADRPGIGSDPEVAEKGSIQVEMGSDSKEVRIGLTKSTELDWQDGALAVKRALNENVSVRVSYSGAGGASFEIPASLKVSEKLTVGFDALWSKSDKLAAAEFNYTVFDGLSATPTIYYDQKCRFAFFLAYIPKNRQDTQLDIGVDKNKVYFGISTRIDFAGLAHR